MKRLIHLLYLLLLLGVPLSGCVEELPLEEFPDNDGAGFLVVESVLTDQLKTQEVLLSRSSQRVDLETDTTFVPLLPTMRGERDSVDWERNARVMLQGSDGSQVNFTEGLPGQYLSDSEFALAQGVDYELEINAGGRSYRSDPIRIAGIATVSNVYAERIINDFGVEGIQIYANAVPVSGNNTRLRYTYEETYKVIAPRWNPQKLELSNYDPCALPNATFELNLVNREPESRVCYNTLFSDRIIQPQSLQAGAGGLQGLPIRFIPRDDFIITHRYSILVRQLVQTPEAYGYYETLDNFSENQSLFSQIQPGALTTNVSRTDGSNEIVLGYVEAANASEQRIFFDYTDYFPGEDLPPYPYSCDDRTAPDVHESRCSDPSPNEDPASQHPNNLCPLSVVEGVLLGTISYTGLNNQEPPEGSTDEAEDCAGSYLFVSKVCGDCQLLGDSSVPEFWED